MRIDDSLGFKGEIRISTFEGDLPEMGPDELCQFLDGGIPQLWRERHGTTVIFPNLTSNVGRQQMTKLIVQETTVSVGYIALSTSVIVPALTDTVLPNEIIRKGISVKQSISTYNQRYVAYIATTDFNSTGINAAALNDTSSTGGNQFADASVTLSKPSNTSAIIDWRVTATTG